MEETRKPPEFGFTQYEAACYTALVTDHPSNGSQPSKASGVARSRIYNVLRNLARKDFVFEDEPGQYVPFPPDELKRRLKRKFETNLAIPESQFNSFSSKDNYEFLLALQGCENVVQKASDIIVSALKEFYFRLFPEPTSPLLHSYIHILL